MIRRISLILLILCMVVGLCACAKPEESQPEETQNDLIVMENGLVLYQITTVNVLGEPLQGVVVQLGDDEHDVETTNEQGFVEFTKEQGNYQVKVLAVPGGYAVADDAFPFPPGKSQMKIIVPNA